MARSELTELLNSDDKGVNSTANTPNGVLAQLFRLMISDMNISLAAWGELMRDYVMDPSNGVRPNRKHRTSERGNMTAAFIKDSMTWKVLVKGFKFLKIVKVDIAIRAYHADGKISLHSTTMSLSTMPNTDELDDDDDDLSRRRSDEPSSHPSKEGNDE